MFVSVLRYFPHDVIGSSLNCDCGIFWSYSLAFWYLLNAFSVPIICEVLCFVLALLSSALYDFQFGNHFAEKKELAAHAYAILMFICKNYLPLSKKGSFMKPKHLCVLINI